MFSISSEGKLFLNGVHVGWLQLEEDRTQRDGMRIINIRAQGLTVQRDDDIVMLTSIAASGAVQVHLTAEEEASRVQ